MSKVYLKVEMRVVVDTDLNDKDDIIDALDFEVSSCGEDVALVLDSEVIKSSIEDAN